MIKEIFLMNLGRLLVTHISRNGSIMMMTFINESWLKKTCLGWRGLNFFEYLRVLLMHMTTLL